MTFTGRDASPTRLDGSATRPHHLTGQLPKRKSFRYNPGMDTEETNVNHQPMPFTITQPLGRLPRFAEIQTLAEQHEVQIRGNEIGGEFCHPNSEQPKVTGHYSIDPNGDIRGDFTGNVIGKLAGQFALTIGKMEVTITEKPFLLPEAILKSTLATALKEFSAKFNESGGVNSSRAG